MKFLVTAATPTPNGKHKVDETFDFLNNMEAAEALMDAKKAGGATFIQLFSLTLLATKTKAAK